MVDEILYVRAILLCPARLAHLGHPRRIIADGAAEQQARVHPAQRANTLSSDAVRDVHHFISHVCDAACAVNADSARFPADWLFSARWGKAKRGNGSVRLRNGECVQIKFVTVGGRTSAVVEARQKHRTVKPVISDEGGTDDRIALDGDAAGDDDDEALATNASDSSTKRQKRRRVA